MVDHKFGVTAELETAPEHVNDLVFVVLVAVMDLPQRKTAVAKLVQPAHLDPAEMDIQAAGWVSH